MQKDVILETKEVTYSYQPDKSNEVLKDISMHFKTGTLYALLGASGSGKSTFLSLLAGLDMPTSGEIFYKGVPLAKKDLNQYRRQSVSLVFQNYNLIDYLTPLENVQMGGSRDPKSLLEQVSLFDAEQRRNVLQLSGGQQQRVAIARALAGNADILLADEPTGNLDEATAQEIIDLLTWSAHEEGKCVIVVTHSKELAKQADETIELYQGHIKRV